MTATRLFLLTLTAAILTTQAAPLRAQPCSGDCDGNGSVAVDELILGVRIALGDAATADCLAVDVDGDGAVAVNELLAAVRRTLDGCGGAASPTNTATGIGTPTPTITPVPTFVGAGSLAAASRIATDPIFRLFDLQESVLTSVIVAARARRTARGGSGGVSGCQVLDCELFGTQQVCCSGTEFSQTFDQCTFTDAGGPGSLSGALAISSASSSLCSGIIPRDASFTLVLDSFTHDVASPDGGFFRSFHQFSESYEKGPADCVASNPDVFGFAIRGSGRRLLDGVLQRFESNGAGDVLTDFETAVDSLAIEVGATEETEECHATAALNGSIGGGDFRAGVQAITDFTGVDVVEAPQDDGSLLLRLNGTAGTDCLGDVTLSTVEPLHVDRGHHCFDAGRLATQLGDSTVSSRYGDGGTVDFDFEADGQPDQHFAACTDVPADTCETNAVGLCGACTATSECQQGLACFACSGDCTGGDRRCALSDAFVTCEDGVF